MKEYSKSKLNRVKRGQIRATYNVVRINAILLLSLFFIGMSISHSQNKAQSKESTNSKKDSQKGYDFDLIRSVVKITDKVVIDGIVNEPFWETIEPLHSTQKVPNAGNQPTHV